MRDLFPALRSYLLADMTIAPAVGRVRIFMGALPQGVRTTSLAIGAVSGLGSHHMGGPSGLMTNRVQVTAWSTNLDTAWDLGNTVKALIDGYRGPMGSGATLVRVAGVFFDDERPLQDNTTPTPLHGCSRDYMITFAER